MTQNEAAQSAIEDLLLHVNHFKTQFKCDLYDRCKELVNQIDIKAEEEKFKIDQLREILIQKIGSFQQETSLQLALECEKSFGKISHMFLQNNDEAFKTIISKCTTLKAQLCNYSFGIKFIENSQMSGPFGCLCVFNESESKNELNRKSILKYEKNLATQKLSVSDTQIDTINMFCFELYENLVELSLYNNQILHIGKHLFYDLEYLKELNLARNKIASIDTDAFVNLRHLSALYLYNNRLRCLHGKEFSGLISLRVLHLQNNELFHLAKETFQELTKIEELYLYNNQIVDIDEKLFRGLRSLQVLDMDNNQILMIHESSFDDLDSIKNLSFANNRISHFNKKSLCKILNSRQRNVFVSD